MLKPLFLIHIHLFSLVSLLLTGEYLDPCLGENNEKKAGQFHVTDDNFSWFLSHKITSIFYCAVSKA